jgi:hypothetical protein
MPTVQRLARRLASQGVSRPARDVVDVVRGACGIQAQDEPAARLAIRARSVGLSSGDVTRALDAGAIVRTWAVRGTLHLLTREDAAFMVPLLGPVFDGKARRRLSQVGLDPHTLERGRAAIRSILDAQGPTPRTDLVARLGQHGVRLEGQARPHLLAHAARAGDLVFASREIVAPFRTEPLERSAGLARLARRYLEGFGPADRGDFARWSGLSAPDVATAWAGVDAARGGVAELPRARLLGAFDNLHLGWREPDVVPTPFEPQVHPGGGLIHPVLLVHGRAAARWRLLQRSERTDVELTPFAPLPDDVRDEIHAEIQDVLRFLQE